jgi:malonyl-CoA/methylmalonyl-CoA synthetase
MLHTLPLHHIHGLVNGVLCALHSGASLDFARFDSRRVWRRLAKGDVSVYMGVPTMYAHLLRVLQRMPEDEKTECVRAAATLRLAVSGSAACPVPVMEEWRSLTGQVNFLLPGKTT